MVSTESKYGSSLPVVLVAPHGPNDINTVEITKKVSDILDVSYVVNNGWEKSDVYDDMNYKADCNKISHVKKKVLKDEFLTPFEEANNINLISFGHSYNFIIHGMGNYMKQLDLELKIIVGAGSEGKWSLSENLLKKFLHTLSVEFGSGIALGNEKGSFSGSSKNNLNQFYRNNPRIQSVQLELIRDLRKKSNIEKTSEKLSNSILNLFDANCKTPKKVIVPLY